jgi:hypothetical protein
MDKARNLPFTFPNVDQMTAPSQAGQPLCPSKTGETTYSTACDDFPRCAPAESRNSIRTIRSASRARHNDPRRSTSADHLETLCKPLSKDGQPQRQVRSSRASGSAPSTMMMARRLTRKTTLKRPGGGSGVVVVPEGHVSEVSACRLQLVWRRSLLMGGTRSFACGWRLWQVPSAGSLAWRLP